MKEKEFYKDKTVQSKYSDFDRKDLNTVIDMDR